MLLSCIKDKFLPQTNYHTKFNEGTSLLNSLDEVCTLIIWNDDFNTFEWVIETLIEVCNHTEPQAEQCAMIIHTKGKYAVKNGDFDTLGPMREAIVDKGINATIEFVTA